MAASSARCCFRSRLDCSSGTSSASANSARAWCASAKCARAWASCSRRCARSVVHHRHAFQTERCSQRGRWVSTASSNCSSAAATAHWVKHRREQTARNIRAAARRRSRERALCSRCQRANARQSAHAPRSTRVLRISAALSALNHAWRAAAVSACHAASRARASCWVRRSTCMRTVWAVRASSFHEVNGTPASRQ